MPEKLCTTQLHSNGVATLIISGSQTATAAELLESLRRQITSVAGNNEIRGVLLTGAGSDFCRCRIPNGLSVHEAAALSGFAHQVTFSLEKIGKPCFAAIEGECSGLGLEIALASDFIVASRSSSFGFPDIATGLIPFGGGTQRLTRLVGKSKTKELIFSGDLIDAEEAHRIGLLNRLYSHEKTVASAKELIDHICTRSPHAIRIGGEVVNAGYDLDLQTACMLERNAFALCFASFDQREGMQAFLDKREPQFRGE